MSAPQRKDDFFSHHHRTRLLSFASERLAHAELSNKCDQLEGEILWWIDKVQGLRDLLEMEQENTSRWENQCYKFQLKTVEQGEEITRLKSDLKKHRGDDNSSESIHRNRPRLF